MVFTNLATDNAKRSAAENSKEQVEGAVEEVLCAQYRSLVTTLEWLRFTPSAKTQLGTMHFAGRCTTNRPSRHARAAASNTK